MLRTVEIKKLEWSYIDLDKQVITLPRSSRQTQQDRVMKKNRTHIAPLSTQMIALLEQQKVIAGDQIYVFPSPQKRNCMLSRTTLNRMLKYMGLDKVTTHDFRATASTALYEKRYIVLLHRRTLQHHDLLSNALVVLYDRYK